MKFRFGDCILDLRARELKRQGEIVSLEPKMFKLLEALISRRPAVITSDELDELLWPKVYVARTSLTRLVSELRAALGDTPQGSQIIRTAYKTGYAFCAEVICAPERDSSASIEVVWNKQVVPLTGGEHIAGRDAECSIIIDASTVSRRHARVTVISGVATIEDLDSTNGTRVNGAPICGPSPIKPGDEVALGSELLQVRRRNRSALTVKIDAEKKSGDALPKK